MDFQPPLIAQSVGLLVSPEQLLFFAKISLRFRRFSTCIPVTCTKFVLLQLCKQFLLPNFFASNFVQKFVSMKKIKNAETDSNSSPDAKDSNMRLLHKCYNLNATMIKKENLLASATNTRLYARCSYYKG